MAGTRDNAARLTIEFEPVQANVKNGGSTGMPKNSYTAILEKEGDMYFALCPELDVASQGATVEEATANLMEAVE